MVTITNLNKFEYKGLHLHDTVYCKHLKLNYLLIFRNKMF